MNTHKIGNIEILNIPKQTVAIVENKGYAIVARLVDGSFWYYGAYELVKAFQIAQDIDGYVTQKG